MIEYIVRNPFFAGLIALVIAFIIGKLLAGSYKTPKTRDVSKKRNQILANIVMPPGYTLIQSRMQGPRGPAYSFRRKTSYAGATTVDCDPQRVARYAWKHFHENSASDSLAWLPVGPPPPSL